VTDIPWTYYLNKTHTSKAFSELVSLEGGKTQPDHLLGVSLLFAFALVFARPYCIEEISFLNGSYNKTWREG